jgi:acetoacetyl-CoA synthetase
VILRPRAACGRISSRDRGWLGTSYSVPKDVELAKGMPSIEKVMLSCYTDDKSDNSCIPDSVYCGDFLSTGRGLEMQLKPLPFDHAAHIICSLGRAPKKEE